MPKTQEKHSTQEKDLPKRKDGLLGIIPEQGAWKSSNDFQITPEILLPRKIGRMNHPRHRLTKKNVTNWGKKKENRDTHTWGGWNTCVTEFKSPHEGEALQKKASSKDHNRDRGATCKNPLSDPNEVS